MCVCGGGLNCVQGVQVCVGRGGSSLSLYPLHMYGCHVCMTVLLDAPE